MKEVIKSFLFRPFVDDKVICQCGKRMKLKSVGSSYNVGDFGFECECGKKLIGVWEFSDKFIHPYDKATMVIEEKHNDKKYREEGKGIEK